VFENINILLPIYCILEVYVVILNLTEAEQIISLVLFDIGWLIIRHSSIHRVDWTTFERCLNLLRNGGARGLVQ
jgi:hypothetical protein